MVVLPSSHGARRGPGRPRVGSLDRPIKELLIDATVRIVGHTGTTDSSSVVVAREAGVQPSTINYNFTSWAHLIAHAGRAAYRDLVDTLWASAIAAPATPEDRLRAFLAAHHDWSEHYPGWAAFFSFPRSARRASALMFELFGEELREWFTLSNTRLYRLAADVRDGVVTEDNFWAETADLQRIMADREILTETVMVGWTLIGMSVWGGSDNFTRMGGDSVRTLNGHATNRALGAMIERLQSV
jgi:AcrR family transcriptional regulator